MKVVIDASLLIRCIKPKEAGHEKCVETLKILEDMAKSGSIEIFEPPEFLLELHSILIRQQVEIKIEKINFLTLDQPLRLKGIVSITESDVINFIQLLKKKYPNTPIKTKKAADLVYLWLTWRMDATLISVDNGLLSYGDQFKVIDPDHFMDSGLAD